MTREQEETIERLKELRDSYELHQSGWANRCLDIIEDYVKNSVYKNKMTGEKDLNILKEKDKEIEKYKGLYNKILADLVKADRKNIENKMVIDLMAERIEWLCKSNGILLDKEHDENFTQEDIKQYFKQKATEMLQEGE